MSRDRNGRSAGTTPKRMVVATTTATVAMSAEGSIVISSSLGMLTPGVKSARLRLVPSV